MREGGGGGDKLSPPWASSLYCQMMTISIYQLKNIVKRTHSSPRDSTSCPRYSKQVHAWQFPTLQKQTKLL